MPDTTSGLYDPMPEESPDEITLQCAGCNERILAATYPPGVPCPMCRSPRRRMADGSILPRGSLLPWIILVDAIVTALLVGALLYYFVWRNPVVPPPPIEHTPAPTVETPTSAIPAPVSLPGPVPIEPPKRPMRQDTEQPVSFLDIIPEPAIALDAGVLIDDEDGDGIPTIRGSGTASSEPYGLVEPAMPAAAAAHAEVADSAIPTISGDDLDLLDEDYVPIEFVNPPAPQQWRQGTADMPATSSSWSLYTLVSGNVHDEFSDRPREQSRWTKTFHQSPDPCQAYFMLSREELLVGATEGRPQGPEAMTWAGGMVGDFEAAIDFRWVLPPQDGQCGMYLECVDRDNRVLAFLDISAWGQDDDARKIIFRCGSDSGAVNSLTCPGRGRIRVNRHGDTIAAAVWDTAWRTIGEGRCSDGEVFIRLSGYSSTSCPRYALALDDFEVKHSMETTSPFLPRPEHRSPTMGLLEPDTDSDAVGSNDVNSGSRPGVVSIREAPLASGAPGPAYSALPYAMSALPTGSVTADLRNQSDRDLMVGFRTEREGLDLRLPAGATKRAMIPAGAYTVVMRPLDEPGRLFESAAFTIAPSSSSITLAVIPTGAAIP